MLNSSLCRVRVCLCAVCFAAPAVCAQPVNVIFFIGDGRAVPDGGGGRIDHAGHSNDLARNVDETIEFANAVQEAIDWAGIRTDTLILVTGDHETGGLLVLAGGSQGELPTVSWSTTGHTGANVPVYAWGANAWRISGVMDNTDLFEVATIPEPAATMLLIVGAPALLHRRIA